MSSVETKYFAQFSPVDEWQFACTFTAMHVPTDLVSPLKGRRMKWLWIGFFGGAIYLNEYSSV